MPETPERGPSSLLVHPDPARLSDPRDLAAARLGGTLYMPASRVDLPRDVSRAYEQGTRAVVLCLEDAVADSEVPTAERNLVAALAELQDQEGLPSLFLRPRSPEQLRMLLGALGQTAGALSGVVAPKFLPDSLAGYLENLDLLEEAAQHQMYLLPILEASELATPRGRNRLLEMILETLSKVQERVLTIRIGATDLSSAYGLRRPAERTVYEVGPVAHAIADIIETFNPAGFTVSGPVWEHWGTALALEGLAEETHLDLLQGLLGKTLIHPSQVPIVNAIHTVSSEDYSDATQLSEVDGGGVWASASGTHMNEARPHAAWARRTLLRARAFGVRHPGDTWQDLLSSGVST